MDLRDRRSVPRGRYSSGSFWAHGARRGLSFSASALAHWSHLLLRCSRTSGRRPTLRFIGGGFECLRQRVVRASLRGGLRGSPNRPRPTSQRGRTASSRSPSNARRRRVAPVLGGSARRHRAGSPSMNLAYHVPVPTPSGAARKHELREAARVVEAAAHGVVRQRRRLAADRGRMLHTSTYAHLFRDHTRTQTPPPSTRGNDFTSHKLMKECMGRHTRIVAPRQFGPAPTASSQYGRPWFSPVRPITPPPPELLQSRAARAWLGRGRRCCRETAHVQKQLETRYAPLRGGLDGATQWHHNSHMADPPALAQGLAQSSRSLW